MTVTQKFQLGSETVSIPPRTDEYGDHYNLIADIIAVYGPGPYIFKADHIILPILTDTHGGWHTPLRIAYEPECIIVLYKVDPDNPYSTLRSGEEGNFKSAGAFYRVEQHSLQDLIIEQQRVDTFLSQAVELHEFSCPHHFVVLPSSFKDTADPNAYKMDDLRLYFLCEWGEDYCQREQRPVRNGGSVFMQMGLDPTSVSFPIPYKRRVHLQYQTGYKITRPRELFDRYGRYLLGMLRVLRQNLVLSQDEEPTMVPIRPNSVEVRPGISFLTNNSLVAVDLMIIFLAQRTKLEQQPLLDVVTLQQELKAGGLNNQSFIFFAPLDNSEIRRLDTHLQIDNRNGTLADLHRVITKAGHVKWLCVDHYEDIFIPGTETAFFQDILTIVANKDGIMSAAKGKVRVDLTSVEAAKEFFVRYAYHKPTVPELDIKIHWKPTFNDLTMIVDKITESDARILRLEMNDIWAVESLSGMKFGKGKYHPLLSLFSNPKLRAIQFHNICRLGVRTSKLPSNQQPFTHLQSIHYLSLISLADGSRLAEVLNLCPNLVDLRLGTRIKFRTEECPKLDRAIRSLKKIHSLHLYMYKSAPEEELRGRVHSEPYTGQSLKEFVSVNTLSGLYALQDYIRRSTTTLEVLFFENNHRKDFILDLTPMTLDHHTSLLFAKLTHLDLQTAISSNSLQLLSILMPHFRLFHLGLGPHVKQLLLNVNFEPIKSLYVSRMSELDLKPLFVAAMTAKSTNKPFQLQSLRLDTIHQTQFLPDLLKAIPLHRLYLENLGLRVLTYIFSTLNLTQLKDLTIDDDEYNWDVEAILARRREEFYPDLNIVLTTVQRREIHLLSDEGGRRIPSGTLSMLPEKILGVVPNPVLHHFNHSSILLNNF
ncbi:hypothetical protein EC991_001065 [Linnemannia zychae]|nr:hypothetical protein EC991_001065 [Linnemannia zychae]